jgi:hypothetical protein
VPCRIVFRRRITLRARPGPGSAPEHVHLRIKCVAGDCGGQPARMHRAGERGREDTGRLRRIQAPRAPAGAGRGWGVVAPDFRSVPQGALRERMMHQDEQLFNLIWQGRVKQ